MSRCPATKQGRRAVTVKQAGFTIIELLVATVVFAVILLSRRTGILAFTRQYYKGVIASNTQSAARSILDDVTRAIQFGGGTITPLYATPGDTSTPIVGYCIGPSKRYSFALDAEIGDTNQHAVVTDTYPSCGPGASPLDLGGSMPKDAKELLGDHMRLSKFAVTQKSGMFDTYDVTIRVVYGDDDLLCSPSIPSGSAGSCAAGSPDAHLDGSTFKTSASTDLQCRNINGNQFCAVSELSTTVQSRVQ